MQHSLPQMNPNGSPASLAVPQLLRRIDNASAAKVSANFADVILHHSTQFRQSIQDTTTVKVSYLNSCKVSFGFGSTLARVELRPVDDLGTALHIPRGKPQNFLVTEVCDICLCAGDPGNVVACFRLDGGQVVVCQPKAERSDLYNPLYHKSEITSLVTPLPEGPLHPLVLGRGADIFRVGHRLDGVSTNHFKAFVHPKHPNDKYPLLTIEDTSSFERTFLTGVFHLPVLLPTAEQVLHRMVDYHVETAGVGNDFTTVHLEIVKDRTNPPPSLPGFPNDRPVSPLPASLHAAAH